VVVYENRNRKSRNWDRKKGEMVKKRKKEESNKKI
jgi:hypothetical protein